MKYCKKCVMPNTRPGITFNKDGVCSACQAYSERKTVDFNDRFEELKTLCDKYRGVNGPDGFDCMIAVSGGKDSHFQTYIIKEKLGMNPLLVTVEDNFPLTDAGVHNLHNISEAFGCDVISMKPNIKAQKIIMRYTFENYAKPTYFIDRYIYTYPVHMAVKFNTSLLIYGENINYEYGGSQKKETYSAKEQLDNGVASGIKIEEVLQLKGISKSELNFFDPPKQSDIDKLDPMYLSYFVEWNSFKNFEIASKFGFHDLRNEWKRSHHIEDFDQVDSRAYNVHPWLKYPKFGHATATDYAARMIRYGLLDRNEAVKLVKKHDHDLDSLCVRDFYNFLGYTEREFWNIIDNFYNKDLFEKNKMGSWKLKQ